MVLLREKGVPHRRPVPCEFPETTKGKGKQLGVLKGLIHVHSRSGHPAVCRRRAPTRSPGHLQALPLSAAPPAASQQGLNPSPDRPRPAGLPLPPPPPAPLLSTSGHPAQGGVLRAASMVKGGRAAVSSPPLPKAGTLVDWPGARSQ